MSVFVKNSEAKAIILSHDRHLSVLKNKQTTLKSFEISSRKHF